MTYQRNETPEPLASDDGRDKLKVVAAIREALEAGPTPGPWSQAHRIGHEGFYNTEVFDAARETIATLAWHAIPVEGGVRTDRGENAAYIASVNPEAITAVLDALDTALERVRVLEEDVEDWRSQVRDWIRENGPGGWIDNLRNKVRANEIRAAASMEVKS